MCLQLGKIRQHFSGVWKSRKPESRIGTEWEQEPEPEPEPEMAADQEK